MDITILGYVARTEGDDQVPLPENRRQLTGQGFEILGDVTGLPLRCRMSARSASAVMPNRLVLRQPDK